jgi:multidrug efflux pump
VIDAFPLAGGGQAAVQFVMRTSENCEQLSRLPVIGDTLATTLHARDVSRFSWRRELCHVVLELDVPARNSLSAFNEVSVRSTGGKLLRLSAFVQAAEIPGPMRYVILTSFRPHSSPRRSRLGHPLARSSRGWRSWRRKFSRLDFPMTSDVVCLSRQMRQAEAQVGFVFLLAPAFIYLFLAAQFESFCDPVTVLIKVTFNQQRDQVLPMQEAPITGAALRLRPILMTSVATILGATPLMFDGGPGSVGRNQIGAVVVGGITAATLLTLTVVPLVYGLISNWTRPALPGLVAVPGE